MSARLDPAGLATQTCEQVDSSTAALSSAEIGRLATGLDPAWEVGSDRLVRSFGFASFGAAFGLATRVALLAEGQGHHPTLEIAWGRLVVTWQTDAIGGITTNDLIMAAKVDRLVGRGLGIRMPEG